MLEVCMVQACRTGSGSECEKAPFVPGHNLAGEGFDVVRMRRTGAYVINVKAHLADNHTCTLCPNRFQGGQVKVVKLTPQPSLAFPLSLNSLHSKAKHLLLLFPLPLTIFLLHLHPHLHPVIFIHLRFKSSQQRCLTGVPSAAAINSFLAPSTTLLTLCCAAPAHWLTTTGIWVWALIILERQCWEEVAQTWPSLLGHSTAWTKPLLPSMKSVAPTTGKGTVMVC